MKRYVIILFVLVVGIQSIHAQSALDRRVTLIVENVPLKNILDTLSKQSAVNFAYNTKRIPYQKQFSLSVKNGTLINALKALFAAPILSFPPLANK